MYLRLDTKVTPYQIWRDRKPNIKYFHIFRDTFYVLNHREQGRKLDDKGQEGIFLGYSPNNCAYRVYLKKTEIIVESANVVFKDTTFTETVEENEEDFLSQQKMTLLLLLQR